MENETSAPQGREEDRTDLINTFSDITSASKEEAIFFLESHNFDLDSAVSTFFEANTALPIDTDHLDAPADRSPTVSPSRSRSRSSSPSPPVASQPNPYNLRSRQGTAPSANQTDKKPSGSRAGGIRTLSDLNRRPAESGSDSDEPQEYYTGGQKSGMLVQDPTKVNDVDSLFNQAREAGAVEGSAGQLFPSASSSRSFQGTGRLLTGETLSSAPQPPQPITHNITFWSNGFTVDDGPLRMLDDPQNAPFLESIRKSECPKELEPADRKTPVHVSLTRREENCPVQQKRQASFHGVGRTLGGTPTESSVAVAAPLPSTVPAPTMGLVVDSALPSTSIQLRLADGTRMVSRFNQNHTIRDIRGFIDASRPGGPRAYHLQTVGFPPKQLTDLDQTIDQASLANSVVIQKL